MGSLDEITSVKKEEFIGCEYSSKLFLELEEDLKVEGDC